ncbi:MAG: hypothetical protein IJS52_03170 [Bacilli bacterium]|nr:hypothetical protein [Bacilli bacterium]
MVIGILLASAVVLYVIGVIVYDVMRRKKGKPSIFADVCEEEGHGKRLVREFRKTYHKS